MHSDVATGVVLQRSLLYLLAADANMPVRPEKEVRYDWNAGPFEIRCVVGISRRDMDVQLLAECAQNIGRGAALPGDDEIESRAVETLHSMPAGASSCCPGVLLPSAEWGRTRL